jgi:quinol monooxygenase YgiN
MFRRSVVCVFALFLVFGLAYVGLAEDDSSSTPAADTLLGHNLFFSLKEPTEENKAALIQACEEFLSQHPGLIFFAVGTRDEKLNGAFNDKNYDVALHMVFQNKQALSTYARTDAHQKFVAKCTPMLSGLRIFDSSVRQVENKVLASN